MNRLLGRPKELTNRLDFFSPWSWIPVEPVWDTGFETGIGGLRTARFRAK